MITPHNAIRQFMLLNAAGTMPRTQEPSELEDLWGGTLPDFLTLPGEVLLLNAINKVERERRDEKTALPIVVKVSKPKGRPPSKHNLRSKGPCKVAAKCGVCGTHLEQYKNPNDDPAYIYGTFCPVCPKKVVVLKKRLKFPKSPEDLKEQIEQALAEEITLADLW